MPRKSTGLTHKVQIPVTEAEWLRFNQELDQAILSGKVRTRTSFAEYLRNILRKHLNEQQ